MGTPSISTNNVEKLLNMISDVSLMTLLEMKEWGIQQNPPFWNQFL